MPKLTLLEKHEAIPDPIKVQDNTSEVVQVDEKQLWNDFVEGSDQALMTLYNRYVDKLYNYGTQLSRDNELVRDTVQDVFVYLVQKRANIKRPDSIKFYIYACFRRKLFKTLERSKKIAYREEYDRTDGFQLTVEPDVKSIHTKFTMDTKRVLESASKRLPTKQREIIMLHYFEGLSIKEVAEVLGYSNSESARNLLYKSLKGLSDILRKHHDDLFVVGVLFSGELLFVM